MKPPPPIPHENGSTTPRTAAAATAASTALPPRSSTSIAVCVASGSTLAAAPPVPVATGCWTGVVRGAVSRAAAVDDMAARSTTAATGHPGLHRPRRATRSTRDHLAALPTRMGPGQGRLTSPGASPQRPTRFRVYLGLQTLHEARPAKEPRTAGRDPELQVNRSPHAGGQDPGGGRLRVENPDATSG